MIPYPHITVDDAGVFCVDHSRVTVERLFAWHQQGTSVETLVKRYPHLGWAKVLSALAFAYDNPDDVRRLEVVKSPARKNFGKQPCSACGKMTRDATAGCDHCDMEGK